MVNDGLVSECSGVERVKLVFCLWFSLGVIVRKFVVGWYWLVLLLSEVCNVVDDVIVVVCLSWIIILWIGWLLVLVIVLLMVIWGLLEVVIMFGVI